MRGSKTGVTGNRPDKSLPRTTRHNCTRAYEHKKSAHRMRGAWYACDLPGFDARLTILRQHPNYSCADSILQGPKHKNNAVACYGLGTEAPFSKQRVP